MNFAFCLSAFGDEHIQEYNLLLDRLLIYRKDFVFYVVTDDPQKINGRTNKIIHVTEPFNYNHKRIAIQHALMDYDTIFYLDTDIIPWKEIDFTIIDGLDDSDTLYVDELYDVTDLSDVNGSLEYMKDYLKVLYDFSPDELKLINEGLFILKINNMRKKNSFINTWERIDNRTREYQVNRYGVKGAMEGLIIWVSANIAKINNHLVPTDGDIKKLYRKLIHVGQEKQKMKKSLI